MNLGRFLLSVNHEDPTVVIRGISEFRQQILIDHDALEVFGYNGRPCADGLAVSDVLSPLYPPSAVGVLSEYIQKSPQLEELFVLWSLPGRDDDRALCSAHMSCIAVVLHCARSNTSVCNGIINRILTEHLKSLHSQLASGNSELVHATLGLLLSMARTSMQHCKDVFQKVNLSSQTLDAVIQKGKQVNWKCQAHSHSLATDSRLLVIIFVCLVLECVDTNTVLELFAEKSLMRKIMHSLGRDTPETLQIALPGVLYALAKNPALSTHVHDIFDGATVKQLVLLYTRPEESIQAFGHTFALQLVEQMKLLQNSTRRTRGGPGSSGGAAGSSAVSVSRCCACLAQYLESHSDSRQREVLMEVLSFQPHLLGRSIASISALKSWEPVPSAEYLGVTRYLTQLLRSAAIDHKTKTQLRATFGTATAMATPAEAEEALEEPSAADRHVSATDSQQRSQSQQSLVNGLLNSWIPPGLTKKDICKMLTHKELSLQNVGLQLVLALTQRLQRAIREAGLHSTARSRSGADATRSSGNAMLEHCVTAAIQSYLPDFQLLVNARSRLVKSMNEVPAGNTDQSAAPAEAPASKEVVVDDFDFNIEGGEEDAAAVVKAEVAKLAPAQEDQSTGSGSVFENLYVALLELMEVYLDLSPQSVSQVKFDLLRVLDEYLPWDVTQSSAKVVHAACALNPAVLLAILKVLRQAQVSVECRWFGSQDDAVKMLINLIVAEDWMGAMKRTVLMKLMLLSVLGDDAAAGLQEAAEEFAEVSRRARTLLKSVLIQSGLFVGYGAVDMELGSELNAWIGALSTTDDSVLTVETVLRLSHHWNTSLSMQAAGVKVNPSYLTAVGSPLAHCEDVSALIPFSPVLFCAMHLLNGNFEVFSSALPKHIRAHIQPEDSTQLASMDPFFDKFRAQFQSVVGHLFGSILMSTTSGARSPHAFCRVVESALAVVRTPGSEDATAAAVQLVSDLTGLTSLFAGASKSNAKVITELVDKAPVALLEYLDSLNGVSEPSAQKPKGKSAKSASANSAATNAYDFSLNHLDTAVKIAAVVSRWASVEKFVLGAQGSHTSLAGFVEKQCALIHAALCSDAERAYALSPAYFEWTTRMWVAEVDRATGFSAKIALVNHALQVLERFATLTEDTYVWTAQDGLRQSDSSSAKSAAARSSRKRAQSDLGSEQRVAFSTAAATFCSAVLSSTTVAATSIGSAMALHLLFSDSLLIRLPTKSWLGSWTRSLYGAITSGAAQHAGSAAKARAIGVDADLLWSRLAGALVQTSLECADSDGAEELRALAVSLLKVVDSAELRRLVVGSASGSAELSALSDLEIAAPSNSDAPALAVVEGVTEDILRAASLAQLLATSQTAQSNASPLAFPLFRCDGAKPAFFMDLGSFRDTGASEGACGKSGALRLVLKSVPFAVCKTVHAVEACASAVLAWSGDATQELCKDKVAVKEVVDMIEGSGATAKDAQTIRELLSLTEAIAAKSAPAAYCASLAVGTSSDARAAKLVLFRVAASVLGRSKSTVKQWESFFSIMSAAFIAAVDVCLASLAKVSEHDMTNATRSYVYSQLADELEVVLQLISLSGGSAPPAVEASKNTLGESAVALKKKLNKLVRNAMKTGIESAAVLQWIQSLLKALSGHGSDSSATLLGATLKPVEEDFYHPHTLLTLVPSHSKFSAILSHVKDSNHAAKAPMLALILHLVQTKRAEAGATKPRDKRSKIIENPAEHFFLAESLVTGYGGTLSAADRICLRILTLLSEMDMCSPLCTVQPRTAGCVLSAQGLRTPEDLIADSARWMVEGITPVVAYSTLSRFPMWRSLSPQLLSSLEESSGASGNGNALEKISVEAEWKAKTDSKMVVSDDASENNDAADEEDGTPAHDMLLQCSEKVFDPAFYMPAFLHVLRNQEVSIRQIANSGALSLIIASLGSPCSTMRTCALACLYFAHNMLEQQTPTRDAAFRERAQLALLFTYIRNAFDIGDAGTSAPRLPVTTAIFLGRAAMNLMQPNHELFGRVNKYLLCRPFCDVKDVPLYDLLLVNGDAQSDQVQRLTALRLFRDGLLTKQDHLNLCRKNAYNRLMLLFPLLAKDTRAGHAVLDLLDRGVSLRFSARYLLERCSITAWIKLLAAPMGAMHLPACAGIDGSTEAHARRLDSDSSVSTHYSKYLVRSVTILRRIVAAAYLLVAEDATCTAHVRAVQLAVASVARDASSAVLAGFADSIPVEYFAQLVLCMWDASRTAAASGHSDLASHVLWPEDLLFDVCRAIDIKFQTMTSQARSTVNKDELVLSLLMLIKLGESKGDIHERRSFLLTRLRESSYAFLIAASGSKHAGHALAITRSAPAALASAASHDVVSHAVLDRVTFLPHYTCACDYYQATMRLGGSGSMGADPQACLDLSWSVIAGCDLNQMMALPTTLGRRFAVQRTVQLLAEGGCQLSNDSATTLRMALVLWNAYGKEMSHSSMETLHEGLLTAHEVAMDALAALAAGGGVSTQIQLCRVATNAVVALHPALHSLHSGVNKLSTEVQVALDHMHGKEATRGETEVISAAFYYFSQLLTVSDHASEGGSNRVDDIVRASLDDAGVRVHKACSAVAVNGTGAHARSVGSDAALADLFQAVAAGEHRPAPALGTLDAAAIMYPTISMAVSRTVHARQEVEENMDVEDASVAAEEDDRDEDGADEEGSEGSAGSDMEEEDQGSDEDSAGSAEDEVEDGEDGGDASDSDNSRWSAEL